MREIRAEEVTEAIRRMCMDANYDLDESVIRAFDRALEAEESPTGVEILKQLRENALLCKAERRPLCQDTGFTVVLAELGQDVHIAGGALADAIHEGVRQGYKDGLLRYSIVGDPIVRRNTGDNSPAAIHVELVPGDRLALTLMAKGGGCENMSTVRMMKPADGVEGVKAFIVDWIRSAGGNPCPPLVVGVGIGGTFELCAYLSKKALFRPLGQPHPDPETAALERDLLEAINNTGLGPMGLGGRTTALGVQVEKYPCHIASLPVAVNLDCHSHRHKHVVL